MHADLREDGKKCWRNSREHSVALLHYAKELEGGLSTKLENAGATDTDRCRVSIGSGARSK